jgi:hypothetical protein
MFFCQSTRSNQCNKYVIENIVYRYINFVLTFCTIFITYKCTKLKYQSESIHMHKLMRSWTTLKFSTCSVSRIQFAYIFMYWNWAKLNSLDSFKTPSSTLHLLILLFLILFLLVVSSHISLEKKGTITKKLISTTISNPGHIYVFNSKRIILHPTSFLS